MSKISCDKCDFCHTRKRIVPGRGNLKSDIVIVGEAPGADEDKQGRPFVGRSGKLLSQALSDLGIDENNVYITNVCKCRPPKNRAPSSTEIQACFPYLVEKIIAINPKIVIILGKRTYKNLVNAVVQINTGRDEFTIVGIHTSVVYHPSYILRCGDVGSVKYKEWIETLKNILMGDRSNVL